VSGFFPSLNIGQHIKGLIQNLALLLDIVVLGVLGDHGIDTLLLVQLFAVVEDLFLGQSARKRRGGGGKRVSFWEGAGSLAFLSMAFSGGMQTQDGKKAKRWEATGGSVTS